jgi:ribosome-binding factor A
MKHRLERVNELIKRELGELLNRECRFDAKLVTVQQVDVTPDLKHAHVFIGIIGTDEERNASMATLHAARTPLQQALSKRVILKFTPHLHFKLDDSVERGDRILHILDEIEREKE